MTLYDDIYEIAADNHGLITTSQVIALSGAHKDLHRLVNDGRLTHIGHGVYRIKHHTLEPNDIYAECVVLVGAEAYLYGESVIAMHELIPTNPTRIYVATPKRVRKKLPAIINLVKGDPAEVLTSFEGIPAQRIPAAIRSCKSTIMPERLRAAVEKARIQGLIFAEDENILLEELG